MSFKKFANIETIDESFTPEQKVKYDALVVRYEAVTKKLTAKLKKTPVNVYSEHLSIKIGLDSFQEKDVPSIIVTWSSFGRDKKGKLQISVSSSHLTKESSKRLAEILDEVHSNYDLIEECMNELHTIERESYSL